MPKIGIFWVHGGTVVGKARDLCEGVECDGRIDSPDQHVTLWERLPEFSKLRKAGDGYESVSRGRVVWFNREKTAVVYMDKVLLRSKAVKNKVTAFFDLDPSAVEWNSDPHYTTDPDEIEKMFGM